jgi:hypothetical protein
VATKRSVHACIDGEEEARGRRYVEDSRQAPSCLALLPFQSAGKVEFVFGPKRISVRVGTIN